MSRPKLTMKGGIGIFLSMAKFYINQVFLASSRAMPGLIHPQKLAKRGFEEKHAANPVARNESLIPYTLLSKHN